MTKPHALVTNDDGIDSGFLKHLVEALLPDFRVSVAAPATEQSWIGRAMSRHNEVNVSEMPGTFGPDVTSWAISGTPSDCVNIALGHLLPEKPDIVLSGINIGFNTTDTLILSSGTVAGAIEGALWDLPAIAFSQCIPKTHFAEISQSKGQTSGALKAQMNAAAALAARFAVDLLKSPSPAGTVMNINFPADVHADSPTEDCTPAQIRLGSLFQATTPGNYQFRYTDGQFREPCETSDRAVLSRGSISRSLLDFAHIGRPINEWSNQTQTVKPAP